MIKITIADAAKKKGIETAYQLQKVMNVSPTIAARLFKGDFEKIGVDTLDKLCEALDCQPNELLRYEQVSIFKKQTALQMQHQLTQLNIPHDEIDPYELLSMSKELGLSFFREVKKLNKERKKQRQMSETEAQDV